MKSVWECVWFFLVKLKQWIPLWRAIPLGLGMMGTWVRLLPLGAELGVWGIRGGQFCSSLCWSSKPHKFSMFHHHSSHLNWLDIACRWEVENKSHFPLLPCVAFTFGLLNCLYLVQMFFVLPCLLHPHSCCNPAEEGSDRAAWWSPGVQSKSTHHRFSEVSWGIGQHQVHQSRSLHDRVWVSLAPKLLGSLTWLLSLVVVSKQSNFGSVFSGRKPENRHRRFSLAKVC